MSEAADEELQQPRRRVPPIVLSALATVAVGAGLLVAVTRPDEPTAPRPTPTVARSPVPSASSSAVAPASPPDALVSAVTSAYPKAVLVEFGVAVPVRANSDRNFQFLAGARRITVVVGPVDARPEVHTTSERDVLVVTKRSGHRVAVSVRVFRGSLRPTELTRVQRLARDSRLLMAD